MSLGVIQYQADCDLKQKTLAKNDVIVANTTALANTTTPVLNGTAMANTTTPVFNRTVLTNTTTPVLNLTAPANKTEPTPAKLPEIKTERQVNLTSNISTSISDQQRINEEARINEIADKAKQDAIEVARLKEVLRLADLEVARLSEI